MTCPHCHNDVDALYLETHIKLRHAKELATHFVETRPVPHFTGQVRKEHFVLCEVCGWQMDKSKLIKHQEFRHPERGTRNSRSPSAACPVLESSPTGADAPIKAASTLESLQAHPGWKQATTEQSQDVTG